MTARAGGAVLVLIVICTRPARARVRAGMRGGAEARLDAKFWLIFSGESRQARGAEARLDAKF